MKTDEPVVLPPLLKRCLEVLVAMTLAVMVAIAIMDEESPTLQTPWGFLDETMRDPVLQPREAPLP